MKQIIVGQEEQPVEDDEPEQRDSNLEEQLPMVEEVTVD